MLFLKYVLMTGGVGLILVALGTLAYALTMEMRYRREDDFDEHRLP